MARDPDSALSVLEDSHGRLLIARSNGRDELWWETYIVRPGRAPQGPRALGSFLNHVPSDWVPVPEPFPERISQAISQIPNHAPPPQAARHRD
jgi:hypothetical protein